MALLSAAGTGWLVYSLDPNEKLTNIVLFYFSSGLFALFTFAFLLYSFRQRFGVREMAKRHFLVSLRQGALIAICFITGLILQAHGLFTWVNSLFLVGALLFLEIFFIYNSRKANKNTNLSDQIYE